MRRLVGLLSIMTLFIALFSVSIFAVTVDSCLFLLEEDGVLESDLSCSGEGIYVNGGFDDITLDCQGHTISCSGSNCPNREGIVIPGNENVVVRNCVVQGYGVGISLGAPDFASSGTYGAIIEDNELTDNVVGIGLYGPDVGENIIRDNEIVENTDYAIYVRSSDENSFSGNILEDTSGYGIYLDTVSETEIFCGSAGIVGDASENHGIYSVDGSDLTVSGCTISGFDTGILLQRSSIATLSDNSLVDNEFGVSVISSDDVSITDSTFTDQVERGVVNWNSDNLLVQNNEFSGSGTQDIFFRSGSGFNPQGAQILDNDFSSGEQGSIYLASGEDVTISGNSFDGYVRNALTLWDITTATLQNNVLKNIANQGIWLFRSTDIFVDSNNVQGSDINFNSVNSEFTSSNNHFCHAVTNDVVCVGEVSASSSSEGDFFDTVSSCIDYSSFSTDCEIEVGSEETYYLENDLYCDGVNGVTILGTEGILDCQGYTIRGSDSTGAVGVMVDDVDEVTIRNCVIENFPIGIEFNSRYGVPVGRVEDTLITESSTRAISLINYDVDLTNVHVLDNEVGVFSSFGSELVARNSVLCDSLSSDLECPSRAGGRTIMRNSYFDTLSSSCALSAMSTGNLACSDASEPSLSSGVEEFPGAAYSCFENSRSSCSDGVDNDGDGLIDCQEESCQAQQCSVEFNDYACMNYECVEVFVPEATQATVVVEETFEFLFTYQDFFTWLENAEVVLSSVADGEVCDSLCASVGKQCLFAEAGRSTCSMEGSSKCTCA